jgi:sulfur carrier protein
VTITVNGKPVELSGEVSITGMLAELKVSDPLYVTVQLNEKLVPHADFDTALVQEGAVVEFLYFMGGGANKFLLQSPFLTSFFEFFDLEVHFSS